MSIKKAKQNSLVTKRRANFSLNIDLDSYLTEVSKATGYTRTAIVEELLRQNLYEIDESSNIGFFESPIMRALEYYKNNRSVK